MASIELIKKHRHYSGWVCFYKHQSEATKTEMKFSVFTPDLNEGERLKTLFWLSGLTCTEENFITKSNFGRAASEERMVIVCPDTSPRGANLPGEDDSYDFASGAGFYLNATEAPWNRNYRMYDYIVEELKSLVIENFPVDQNRMGIFGHSMGGHGALTIGLKNPDLFKSISAFSPIVAPSLCPWGQKAFSGYLGSDREKWKAYDASQLVSHAAFSGEILIDQGLQDEFLENQLMTQKFLEAAESQENIKVNCNFREGFDHSYYFISSFIDGHLRFHSQRL